MIHDHAEYFGIPASWNYMEVGQGRVHVILLEVLRKNITDVAVTKQKEGVYNATDFYA